MRLLIALGLSVGALILTSSRPIDARIEGRPTLPRAALLKGLFAGQRHLVTDYFWLLTINRIGAANTAEKSRDIYHYADLVTELDPEFETVYPFAAVAIPIQREDGSYANLDEAEALLRKGAKHHPSSRRILFQLAFNLMFYEGRYRESAALFEQLSRDPTAPSWYGALASRLYAAGGDLETSEFLTRNQLETCFDPEECATYERRLLEIRQEILLREIDAAVSKYRERTGHGPADLPTLVASGLLPGWPQDPLEGEIFLDDKGTARASSAKHRLELIRDKRELTPPALRAPTP